MPGMTEADSYKHMECLGGIGMRLQSFLTNGHFVTHATPGTPASNNCCNNPANTKHSAMLAESS